MSSAALPRPERAVEEVGPERATEVLRLVHTAFAARPALDPPSTATAETEESLTASLSARRGLLATESGEPVGAMLLSDEGDVLHMRRVSVLPSAQGRGVARRLVAAAEQVAARDGFSALVLTARAELPATVEFWGGLGYAVLERRGRELGLGKALPLHTAARTAEDTRLLGERLAPLLEPGDLVILSGDLGAGKTTFTQGLGAGLRVRGDVTSPTFVISRVHPSLVDGPPLVHVDAYRLGGIDELDDLDLDTSLDDAVTVVEWGEGIAEGLAETRLEVQILRGQGGQGADDPPDGEDPRRLHVHPVGGRWVRAGLRRLLA